MRKMFALKEPGLDASIVDYVAIVGRWPDREWGDRPIWVVLSDWGPLPESREAMEKEALALVRDLGAPHERARFLHFEGVAGGFKWAALVEVR
jgi:hypothetical protein